MSNVLELLAAFPTVRSSQKQYADDRIDKLNRSVTVILFLTAAGFILSRSFGSTIVCLKEGVTTTPIDMTYVNDMCFAQGTLKLNDFFGSALRDRTPSTLSFSYPWMALIAAALALLFYLPYLLWKCFVRTNSYQHVPIDITGVMQRLRETSALDENGNEFGKKMKSLAAYMDRCFALSNFQDGYLDEHEEFDVKGNSSDGCLQRPKTYRDRVNKRRFRCLYVPLVLKYLLVKLIYLLLSIGVFPLIDILFGFRSLTFVEFGYQMTSRLCNVGAHYANQSHSDYVTSQYFPRHVLCKLKIRADAHEIHEYTFQCGLPANVFNEIVFLVLWFWLATLVVLNTFSLFSWLFVFARRRSLIRDILVWPFHYNYKIDQFIDSFVYDYLSGEGFLVIMLIKSNTQDWYCRVLMRILWTIFMKRTNNEHVKAQGSTTTYESDMDITNKLLRPENQPVLNQVDIKETPFTSYVPRMKESKKNLKSPEQEVKNYS